MWTYIFVNEEEALICLKYSEWRMKAHLAINDFFTSVSAMSSDRGHLRKRFRSQARLKPVKSFSVIEWLITQCNKKNIFCLGEFFDCL